MSTLPPSDDIKITDEYTFDQLSELFKTDPELFEKVRQDIINEQIEKISKGNNEQKIKMERMQFRIDSSCRNVKSPQVRCEIVAGMMYNSLFQLNDALHGRTVDTSLVKPAPVLPIDKRKKDDEQSNTVSKQEEEK